MIQSVSRALDILTIVSDAKGKPIKLNAIAQKAGLNVSTCTHLVQTRIIDGVKYILIAADDHVEVNGVSINIAEN